MYPGMIVNYDDQSDIPVALQVTNVANKPLFTAVFTSDKGPEEWMRVSGEKFFDAYGKTISFARHGQPLLQAAMTINAGAELFCKRLVADDATLANIGIVAELMDNPVTAQSTDADGKPLYFNLNETTGKTEQVTDVNGNLLYLDENGAETTTVTDRPYMASVTTDVTDNPYMVLVGNKKIINYSVVNATKAQTIEEAKEEIEKNLSGTEKKLLYVIADNGRGESKKRIKIVPNYKLSRSLNYVLYTLTVIEGTNELESMTFSINSNLIVSGENISLSSMVNTHSTQIKCIEDGENIEWLATEIVNASGAIDAEDNIYQYDALFGCTNKGEAIAGVAVSSTGIDLKNSYGQKLAGGTNGALGAYPFSDREYHAADADGNLLYLNDSGNATTTKEYHATDTDGNLLYLDADGNVTTVADGNEAYMKINEPYMKKVIDEYIKQGVDAFTGAYDTSIFNVDQNMIVACVDANYPDEIKIAIADLANFREDFVFFRDMGLNKNSYELIKAANDNIPSDNKTKFVATYCQSYDVIDPYTKKQITVTIGYDLAQKLVAHCNNGCILPTAGIKYSMTIDNAIYGTLSFAPVICPEDVGFEGNQKEKLDDLHVNYASYINNQLVLESLYTSQDKISQWSYINNVMGIQEVVKAIRLRCPAIRYTFIDSEDLEQYKSDVEDIIAPYKSNFKQLSLEFISDATYSANKIFYAALKVVYKDFVQTEWFKVTALQTVEETEY